MIINGPAAVTDRNLRETYSLIVSLPSPSKRSLLLSMELLYNTAGDSGKLLLMVTRVEYQEDTPSSSLSSTNVLSLKALCRCVIRNHIGLSEEEVKTKLTSLPPDLREYLCYESSPVKKEIEEIQQEQKGKGGQPLTLLYNHLVCRRGCNAAKAKDYPYLSGRYKKTEE